MTMSLRLLGGFELLAGEPANHIGLPNGRATTLLKLLSVRRNRAVPMDSVVEALWSGEPPDTAVQIVSSLVSRLRRRVGDDLQRLEDGYRLDTNRWTVDLDEAIQLVQTSERRLNAGEPALADAAARRAVSMLSLELLAGSHPTDWLARARTENDALLRRARRLAWRSADALGDHDRARAFAEAAIATDSLDEAAYRALMLAQYRSGEPALALRTYARLAEELEEQLGTSPDAATDQLHVTILRGAQPAPHSYTAATVFVPQTRTLVGRDDVLDRAEGLWHEVVAGTERSLLVRGTPGSGRTAVLAEVVRHARTTGGAVLSATCSASTRPLTLHPIAAALRSYCATTHPDVVRATLSGFENIACQLVPDLAESVRTDRLHDLGPELQQTRLVETIVQFVAQLATQQPVLIAIDDIDQADRLTLSTLAALRERLRESPVAILATSELGWRPPTFSPTSTVCLTPLNRSATTELAERAQLGRLGDIVHALTAGHPRFVVEALHAARRGSSLTDELPPSLVAVALDRIEHAGSEVVDALTVVAALGRRFTGAEAIGLLPDRGVAVLRHAITAGLLVAEGNHLAFESELLRAALCTATPVPLRTALGLDPAACVPVVAGAA
ncbi:DNA-binding SARP family transcriptional activator [Kribbella pratensis]|uniref:DNA-binding SARP family transcriptional activator n=1 Tax=Kribbella pratensis TaxID=2512112 RepID=A0ABY2FKZ0_9ACTN|nr:AAA family ATPase [Kribbella pratensis]TDW93442.1 DNA-binding SARP family transcriptional activator [Kribbella pratensis]